jgi:hypothetical protein
VAKGGGAGTLATKVEAEVLVVRHATFISCRSSILRKLRKVGIAEERGDVDDRVEALIEALDDVGDEVRVGDRGTDLGEGVGRGLLAVEVVSDGEVPLFDIAEFLGEVNLAGLLVVVEEAVNDHPHRVRVGGSDGGIGGSRGRNDEVDDVQSHGAIEPAENQGVEPEPCGVRGGRHRGEVILKGVGGDGHGEEGAPLGEDVRLEVEEDQDERPDVWDDGGLHREVGRRRRPSRLEGRRLARVEEEERKRLGFLG